MILFGRSRATINSVNNGLSNKIMIFMIKILNYTTSLKNSVVFAKTLLKTVQNNTDNNQQRIYYNNLKQQQHTQKNKREKVFILITDFCLLFKIAVCVCVLYSPILHVSHNKISCCPVQWSHQYTCKKHSNSNERKSWQKLYRAKMMKSFPLSFVIACTYN